MWSSNPNCQGSSFGAKIAYETFAQQGAELPTFLPAALSLDLYMGAKRELPAERHPAAVYLGRLAPGSRRAQRQALSAIAAWLSNSRSSLRQLPWHRLRYPHTAAIRTWLQERYKPATANRHLAALRGVLAEAWRLGYMDAESYQRAVDLPGIRGTSLPRGRALPFGEIRELFSSCDARKKPSRDRRDAAALALMYGCGLRADEVCRLQLDALSQEDWTVKVTGKGRRERIVPLPEGAKIHLGRWLELRGPWPGPILTSISGGGRIEHRGYSSRALYDQIQRRGRYAGIGRFSPHDLRRTYCTELIERGADLSVVRQLAGHANISTTAIYDRRGELAKKRAANLIVVPD